jgi:hypothetical protein
MRRLTAITMGALALTLAAPSAAGATIVVQQGIGGVKLGMRYTQVRAALGAPAQSYLSNNPFLGRVRILRFGLTRVYLPAVPAARVIAISTTNRAERTVGGVGVGSTQAFLQRRLPTARCRVESIFRHCVVGVPRPGRVITDFAISSKKLVAGVLVARLPLRPPPKPPPA